MAAEEIYEFEPDYIVAPGETLMETIESLGITQTELAKRTGRPLKTINGIIKGNTAITPETALQLEKALGIPSSFWINLESNYREQLAKKQEQEELSKKIEWLDNFPLKEIENRGFIRKGVEKIEKLKDLYKFFGVASVNCWEEIWEPTVAFRKSEAYKTNYYSLAAWIRMVELESRKIECKPFNKESFKRAIEEARNLTVEEDPSIFIPKLQSICAEAGVAVVFVPELPGCRASGVTKWVSPSKAIIGLSLRYRSNDHLWFTFFHEAGHIILHGKKITFIEGVEDQAVKQKEEEADKFASNVLIPKDKYKSFIENGISYGKVLNFAKEINIDPGIIVGRLQHDKIIKFSQFNKLKKYYKWNI